MYEPIIAGVVIVLLLFFWISFLKPWIKEKLRNRDAKIAGMDSRAIKLIRKPLKSYTVSELRSAWYLFNERHRFDLRKSTRLRRRLLKTALRQKIRQERRGG
jgi:hypothetical protein